MSLPSLENTSTSTIPTELTVSPYFRQSREFMGDTNERMVVENAGHNSTPVPTANIVTISPVV
ncbi:1194_t:CDS:1, partial [Scutellospora calospora]